MPDLNEEVLPVVWSLVRRELREEGAVAPDELVRRLTPFGLIQRDRQQRSRHVGPSARALEQLGLLTRSETSVRLAEPELDDPAFRLAAARRLLAVPEDEDPWARRGDGLQLEHHLQLAVAWLCLQGLDSGLATFTTADRALHRQLGADRALLRDTAPYDTLRRLVTWLGVGAVVAGADGATALVPDPTPLVRAALDELVEPGATVPMTDVMARTAALFPWLPHGRVGRAVAARMREVPDDSARQERAAECLSLALVRLRLDGALTLERGDDPRQRVVLSLGGGDLLPVAHVVRA